MKERLQQKWKQKLMVQKQESIWGTGMKIVLLLSFLVGILAANVMGRERVSGIGILNDYFIERFQYNGVDGENLFFYIFGQRMPVLVLLLLLAFCTLGVFCGVIMLGWQGFSIGFMMSTAIAKYGVRGILLILGGMFPQYLIYLPLYLFYCYFTLLLRKRACYGGESGLLQNIRGRNLGAGVLISFLMLILFTVGIFLESYANPIVLKRILKIF